MCKQRLLLCTLPRSRINGYWEVSVEISNKHYRIGLSGSSEIIYSKAICNSQALEGHLRLKTRSIHLMFGSLDVFWRATLPGIPAFLFRSAGP